MILALLISLLVALFWLYHFQKLDKYEREPDRLILLTFFAGVLATVPSVLLEIPFQVRFQSSLPPVTSLVGYFFWVGLVEESFKFLAVRLTAYRSREFNEVMDGMIYMISAALGFAATENVGYLLGLGLSVWFLRAILSYLGHVSFSAILGYYLGKAKMEGRKSLLWLGFLLSVSLHCLYDSFLVAGHVNKSGFLVLLGALVWMVSLLLTLILARKAQAVSPFRATHLLPKRLTRLCGTCGKRVPVRAPVCHHCRTPLVPEEEEVTLKA